LGREAPVSYKLLHPLESGPDVSVYLVQDSWKSGISRVLTPELPSPKHNNYGMRLIREEWRR